MLPKFNMCAEMPEVSCYFEFDDDAHALAHDFAYFFPTIFS
jgi:hypothetical protein